MTKRELARVKRLRLIQLKNFLRETDYIALKYAEGEITMSEFSTIRENRRAWRAEINALESELKALGD